MARTGYLAYRWFAVEREPGSWCVMPLDEPPDYGVMQVADFTTRELAEHIAEIHNQWLEKGVAT